MSGDTTGAGDHVSPVRSFYDLRSKEGDEARKVSWRTIWGQEFRFEVLCEVFDRHSSETFSVLDVGCGLGDLAGYLRRRADPCVYLGVDILPQMVEHARQRFPKESFEVVDILEDNPPGAPFDFVIASGTLSVKLPGHEDFLHRMLSRMYALASRGLAFNMQSARAATRNVTAQLDTDIYYADPLEVYAYCRTLCPRTILREDFVGTDFAIFLFPGPSRAHRGYEHYLSLDPPRADRSVGMAFLHLEQQLPEEALSAIEAATETAEVLNYRGLSLLHLGRASEAEAPLRTSLELAPDQLNAPVNLGAALAMQGDMEGAMRVWEEALVTRPDNQSARIKLANALIAGERPGQALDVASGLEDPSLRDNLKGLALAQLGQLEEARVLLEQVAARNPAMSKVRYELGQLLEMLQDEPAAAQRYLEALRLNPEHRSARKAVRRMVLIRRGQGSGPAAALREVVSSFAANGLSLAGPLLQELDR